MSTSHTNNSSIAVLEACCELAFEIEPPEEFLIILQRLHLPTIVEDFADFVNFHTNIEGYHMNVISD